MYQRETRQNLKIMKVLNANFLILSLAFAVILANLILSATLLYLDLKIIPPIWHILIIFIFFYPYFYISLICYVFQRIISFFYPESSIIFQNKNHNIGKKITHDDYIQLYLPISVASIVFAALGSVTIYRNFIDGGYIIIIIAIIFSIVSEISLIIGVIKEN